MLATHHGCCPIDISVMEQVFAVAFYSSLPLSQVTIIGSLKRDL